MSRIGKLPIPIPDGVSVDIDGTNVLVRGPKGELSRKIRHEIQVLKQDGKLIVKRVADDRLVRSLHGLTRTLVSNMVKGVTEGFTRNLEIVGVGYRAQMEGGNLVMQLGYSHPVKVVPPPGLEITVAANTKIQIKGFDKQLVGDLAASIRDKRLPDVYKGKGIRYQGEAVRRKAGKAAAKKK